MMAINPGYLGVKHSSLSIMNYYIPPVTSTTTTTTIIQIFFKPKIIFLLLSAAYSGCHCRLNASSLDIMIGCFGIL